MTISEVRPNRDQQLRVQQVQIGKLRPWADNPRIMSSADMEGLKRSLDHWGLVEPIVVRRADNTIVGGHQRLQAAIALGLTRVPVVYLDISQAEAKALNLALNRIHGDWDLPKLGQVLEELRELPGLDEALTGFGSGEMEDLLAELERSQAPPPYEESFDVVSEMLRAERSNAPTKVQPGELWQLGRHRLLCGDATDAGAWEKLMAGREGRQGADRAARKAHAVITDPPYGVAYCGGRAAQQERIAKARRGIDQPSDAYWDDMTPEAYRSLVENALTLAHRHSDSRAALYLWFASAQLRNVLASLERAGWVERNLIVWVKNNGAGALFAQYKHWYEPCFYAHKQGKSPRWHGPHNETTVWEHDKPARNELHPTMKPLALIERAIRNSTAPGQVVVDPFLGSGTAIIAAARCGRICFGMDLEPRYCDIILRRFEAFSGEKASRCEA
jgi:DNA modification methylase